MARFLDALKGTNRGRPPVWLMRQAGRYLPEYRAIRQRHTFEEMAHTPELIQEVTELPLKRYPLDAAILFSDILVILEALGKSFQIVDSVGPVIQDPVRSPQDVLNLSSIPAHEALSYVSQGILGLKRSLKVPLIGFCGGPFTVASYLIEGGSSKQMGKTFRFLYREPESFRLLLEKIADASAEYLKMQVEAGVDAIQIFDTWSGELSAASRATHWRPTMQNLVNAAKGLGVPVTLFVKADSVFFQEIPRLGFNGLSLDCRCRLAEVRKVLPSITLQGNLDPYLLFASKEHIQSEVNKQLHEMKNDTRYICNLGHGVLPDTDPAAVQTLVETVLNFDYAE